MSWEHIVGSIWGPCTGYVQEIEVCYHHLFNMEYVKVHKILNPLETQTFDNKLEFILIKPNMRFNGKAGL